MKKEPLLLQRPPSSPPVFRRKDLLHVALVGLDHFLRRVTHRIVRAGNPCGVWLFCLFSQIAGDVTRAAFEFPEVLFRRFPVKILT